jgi:hypothetical protein
MHLRNDLDSTLTVRMRSVCAAYAQRMRSVQSDAPQKRPRLHAYGTGARLAISKEAMRVTIREVYRFTLLYLTYYYSNTLLNITRVALLLKFVKEQSEK